MKVQSKVVKEGERICVDARFNVKFIGDWESVLQSNSIEVVVDNDNLHRNDDSNSNFTTMKWTEGPLWLDGCFYFTDTIQGNIYRLSSPSVNADDDDDTHHRGIMADDGSSGSNEPQQNKNKKKKLEGQYYELIVWAIHAGGIDPINDPQYSHSSDSLAIYLN